MTEIVSHARDLGSPTVFRGLADGFAFGGDYNPEQWPEEVWAEDVALMQRAGVNIATVGIFSWGLIETADGVFDWSWLDRILELLHEAGIGVVLATPTAAPPMWLMQAHPEIATVDERGVRTAPGGRLAWSPSSATFRRYALRMVRALAERYGTHPALRLWHVSNELGNENAVCHSDETAAAWRVWLAERYGSVAAVNEAWGTAFWGHRYGSFAEIETPRLSRTSRNPGLLLDFAQFGSDALLGHYLAERELLREITPQVPVTTNFMVMGEPGTDDYPRWAQEMDIVSNDHYLRADDPFPHADLTFSADRVRGMAGGRPWLLMEHSTSAVNWQGVNIAKAPGELARTSIAHIAHGSDSALFFQWRQSTAGAEQFHSAMVPHAGADSRVFREVEELGALLGHLAAVAGTSVEPAQVALLFDDRTGWLLRSTSLPSDQIRAADLSKALHRHLTALGIAVDVVPPDAPLDRYKLVLAPTLPLADETVATALDAVVSRGGHVLVGYLSGWFDAHGRALTGGYPGRFRTLLGIRTQEVRPLLKGETVTVDAGWSAGLWTEDLELDDAVALARYTEGILTGVPALTRRSAGPGSASYLATRPDEAGMERIVSELVSLAGITPVAEAEQGIELTRRVGDGASYLFAINRADVPRTVQSVGVDLVSGTASSERFTVPAGGIAVIRESR